MTEGQNGRPPKETGTSRPFRSALFFYGGLAIGAGAAFVLATGWTWWRMYKDQKRAAREARSR
jgi:hypothetical protein